MKSTNKSRETWYIIKSELNHVIKAKENINIIINEKFISDTICAANLMNFLSMLLTVWFCQIFLPIFAANKLATEKYRSTS